jgi:hypothetical protein
MMPLVKYMSETIRTFTVTFDEREAYGSSLSIDLGQIAIPIPCDRPIEDLLKDFHEALKTLKENETGSVIVSLKPEFGCEARLEKNGSAACFSIVSRQRHWLAPNDGKERYIVVQHLDYEKMERRLSKGIMRYLEDPKRKKPTSR